MKHFREDLDCHTSGRGPLLAFGTPGMKLNADTAVGGDVWWIFESVQLLTLCGSSLPARFYTVAIVARLAVTVGTHVDR